MKNVKMWKYSGIFLIVTGVLHTLIAIVRGRDVFWDMIQDGLFNSVSNDCSRQFPFWFLVCGIIIIFMGQILNYYIKREQKPAPLFLGYNLLIFSIIGCIIIPISGIWLFIPQALIIIFANKKDIPTL